MDVLKEMPNFDRAENLDELHRMLDEIKVKNGWSKKKPGIYPEPKQAYLPAHWHYGNSRAALHAAGRLVGTEWAERRNLILANPTENVEYPTVTTLVAAYQMVKAGETARSHRHTPNAMRIVVEASPGTFTLVDGVNVPMEPGDVLLTPSWAYHGHDNRSDSDAYWIDILDAPLVQLLGPMFFEHHPKQFERSKQVEIESPLRFAYSKYKPTLLATKEGAPGVRTLKLGPPELATFSRTAIHIEAGATYDCARSTANDIYVVVEGRGKSTIDVETFPWGAGDVIAAPSWMQQKHVATEGSVMIRVSDEPAMRAFNWLR